jgi:hypothetical protein
MGPYSIAAMKLLIYWLLLLLLLPAAAYADEPRVQSTFTSPNGRYELRVVRVRYRTMRSDNGEKYRAPKAATWVLFDKASGRQQYRVRGFFEAQTVHVADDGHTLAVVNDWSTAPPVDALEVLAFYQRGRKTRSYHLAELLCSTYNVSKSVGHFSWLDTMEFEPAQAVLRLKTYELRTLSFDARHGTLTSNELHPLVTPTAFLGYGRIRKLGPDAYELEVCQRIHGPVPATGKIPFTSSFEPELPYQVLLIDQGRLVAPELTYGWLLNQCAYQAEQHPAQADPQFTRGRALKACP